MSPRTKVLLVEDEAVVALHLRASLEHAGYEVTGVAKSASTAIAAVRATHPDLVLMDIGLNGPVDGIDAAREINERFATPVVFITGTTDDLTMTRATEAGPYGYLIKPVNERELLGVIELALGRHRREEVNRRVERWLLLTLRGMAEAVTVIDQGGKVAFLNPAAEALTGWSMAEAIGRDHAEVLNRADVEAEASRAEVGEVLKTRRPTRLGSRAALRRRGGGTVGVQGNLSPVFGEADAVNDEDVRGVVLVVQPSRATGGGA